MTGVNKYLLGVDNGNTVTKVSLFDLQGKELYVASRSAETILPKPGWAERSMNTLWDNTAQAIRETLDQTGIKGEDIAAIGCTGHGNGLYLLNKAMMPFNNAIQSIDTRAISIVSEWEQENLRARIFDFTPQAFYPAQTPALLVWLKQHDPASYEQIGAVLMCKDYINYRLTGELTSDYTDMSAANLIDTFNKCYSSELLAQLGISEIADALPRLVASLEIVGEVTLTAASETGLAAGTPVIGGMIDIDASAIGAGVIKPGYANVLIGTWSINQVIVEKPIVSPDLFLVSPFADPRFWLVLEGSATSASNLEWFVKHFCPEAHQAAEQRNISVYDVCNELVNSVRPEDSIPIFHPFVYGSNVHPNASAGFYGVMGWHSHTHFLRAVYEGIAFGHLHHIEKLQCAGADFSTVRLAGGGARSKVWGQMFADLLNVKIEMPLGYETGTRGAALSAGVATKLYSDFDEATEQAVKIVQVYYPEPHYTAIYRTRYEQYKAVIDVMSPVWQQQSKLV
jgi:L-xylulokinase